jgi:hypothetical protein
MRQGCVGHNYYGTFCASGMSSIGRRKKMMVFEPQIISPTPSPPSRFVNALGWILILLGGFAACFTIFKKVIFPPFFPQGVQQSEQMPILARMMFSHSDYFLLFVLILSIAMLTVGIGLLKRKNWARVITITTTALGVMFNIAFLVILFTLFPEMTNMSGGEPIAVEIQKLLNFIQNSGAVLAIILLVFQFFIIKKLSSPKVKEEFQETNDLILGMN